MDVFYYYYDHIQMVFAVLFSAFSIKETDRQTDRLNTALRKAQEDQG